MERIRLENMDTQATIELWKKRLNMEHWGIETVSISPEQVEYDQDVPEEDRFFIGIVPSQETKTAVIFYDRPLQEEDILHELLHAKYPTWSHDKVISWQNILIKREWKTYN